MVEFLPMTLSDYELWRRASVSDYAQENVVAGKWKKEDAESRSEHEFAMLLPNGPATPDNYLRTIVDEVTSERVGIIWYAVRQEDDRLYVFVYDFQILKDHRRKGFGTQALLHLDGEVKKLGLGSVSLHVFAHNRAARDLYSKVGYEETDLIMRKSLL